jgi:putative endonuclease
MYYLYILYSEKYDMYYVGQTNDLDRRMAEHNTGNKNTFTRKYRPWKLVKSFEVSDSLGRARKVENYIKRLKSRKYIEQLIQRESIEDLLKRIGG